MPSDAGPAVRSTAAACEARRYYDRPETSELYARLWGGEDIHIGIYAAPGEPVLAAGRRTLARAGTFLLPALGAGAAVLDLGSGTGGTARWLAGVTPARVVGLNISGHQNAEHRARNRATGLHDRIAVVGGDFEALPFGPGSFDAVCSFDSFLHSGNRPRLLGEVARVLRPGGHLVFTDIMRSEDCPAEALRPLLDRVALSDMASVADYRELAGAAGLVLRHQESHQPELTRHYSRILDGLEAAWDELAGQVDVGFLENTRAGLERWVDAGRAGHLDWGFFHFTRG